MRVSIGLQTFCPASSFGSRDTDEEKRALANKILNKKMEEIENTITSATGLNDEDLIAESNDSED